MKALKAAAVLAGSIVIAGAAAPAFAGGLTPTGLNGGLDGLTGQPPLDTRTVTDMLDTDKSDSVVNEDENTMDVVDSAEGPAKIIGSLPLAK